MNRRHMTIGGAVAGTLAVLAVLIGLAAGGSPGTGRAEPAHAGTPATTDPTPATTDGSSGHARGGGSGEPSGEAGTGDPAGGPVAPGISCEEGEFRTGEWWQPREGAAASLVGISAAGDDGCVRLRIEFGERAPGVRVWRYPVMNTSAIRFAPSPGGGLDVPYGPVGPDLIWPESALLRTAMVTHDGLGLTVKAFHGTRTDLAARVVLADRHIDVYFRVARAADPRLGGAWEGSTLAEMVTGMPVRGLAVTHVSGALGGGVIAVEGYARAPESTVVVRVHQGDRLVCSRALTALGPPYLFSYFGFSDCVGLPAGHYEVQVGWADPAGAGADVWQWYEVEMG
jgi:hypothetical protein